MADGNVLTQSYAISSEDRGAELDRALREAISWVRLEVHFKASSDGVLKGNVGGAFRRTFSDALRRISENVKDRAPTAYHYIIETLRPAETPVLRASVEAPRSFVLRPPPSPTTFWRGDLIPFEVVLIGRSLDFLPEVVAALQLMGQGGIGSSHVPCALRALWQPSATDKPRLLFDGAVVVDDPEPERLASYPEDRQRDDVTLHFLSPARIIVDGGLRQRSLSFSDLLRALFRRVSTLAAFHGNGVLDLDFGALIERAATVSQWQKAFASEGSAPSLGRDPGDSLQRGFLGKVRYVGPELSALMPIIRLGEALHVGKGTAHGAGRYVVSASPSIT
ncbi:MAG: CRISPR system precrRNA processing endoribonuclease RAMP protein Cas6 [Deltaproteobacteria bacterium]|nr:CRISPR system precrRNA processing endoribonuclease RAMP protein Cas6 [Deltaproteobacteria bacterium]